MKDNTHEIEWDELKDMWINSSETRKIHIKIGGLLSELKAQVSQFEKDAISKDLATVEASWKELKGMTSQFEKDAINRDVARIKVAIRRFLNLLGRKE